MSTTPPPLPKNPPPLPPKPLPQPPGAGGSLGNANQNTPPGGQIAGAPILPCEWILTVRVHSQEKFWPGPNFDVKLHKLAEDGALAAAVKSKSLKMMSKKSPSTKFQGSATKTYGVTATVYNIAKEADWVLTAKDSTDPLPNKAETVTLTAPGREHVDLYTRHPLWVYLQLKFKDPENREITFPPDLPVKAYNDATEVASVKTTQDGKLEFELDRKYDWFTLKFGDGQVLISNGDGTGTSSELKETADAKDLALAGHKYFSPPDTFSLMESIWDLGGPVKFVSGEPAYVKKEAKFYVYKSQGKKWVRRIGEKNAPLVMTLDPHWQFARFEYFDRYYGHPDHDHKRVSIPAVPVEGYYDGNRDGTGHWLIQPDDRDKTVHCVPWIRQKDAQGDELERPVAKCSLQFATDANTFSSSKDANTRKIEILDPVTDAARLAPSAARLKLYDLPQVWKTAGYYTRYPDGGNAVGKFYADLTDGIVQKSRGDPASALVFSLDDIVLTDAAGAEVALTKDDKVAVFYHRFKPAANAGKTTAIGLHRPDSANNQSFYSEYGGQTGQYNYVTDYPNWVRLVVAQGGLYDTFDQRTTGQGGNQVYGARAAALWFDPGAGGVPIGTEVPALPPAVNKNYFALQPYYGQDYNARWKQYDPKGFSLSHIGRFDMALMRCCDRDGDKELAVNMQYFRFNHNWLSPPAISNVKYGASDTEIIRFWDTDRQATSGAEDVPGKNGFGDYADDSLVTNHEVTTDGLTPGTEYQFRLKAVDADTNTTGYSGAYLIATLPTAVEVTNDPGSPDITDIMVTPITANAATVQWTQPAAAAGYLEHGPDATVSAGKLEAKGITDPSFDLAPPAGSKYYFRVSARQYPVKKGEARLWRKMDVQWFRAVKGPFKDSKTRLEWYLDDQNADVAKLTKEQWIEQSSRNLINRFNGEDVVNGSRTELRPQDPNAPIWGEVVYFIQPVKNANDGHYELKIGTYGRCSMSPTGVGEIDTVGYKPEEQYHLNSYTFAHELGHGASLPDEYGEDAQWASAGTPGILCNIPGDPFVDEAVTGINLPASIFKANIPAGDAPASMMNEAVEVRNRHYWHNAEFMRKYTNVPLKVKWDKYHDYKVPGHPDFPVKTYAYWPAKAGIDATLGSRGKMDAYIYTAGADAFTQTYVPDGPHDGFLMIVVKMKLIAPAGIEAQLAGAFRSVILDYNAKYYATGSLDVTTDNGAKPWNFGKCRLQVSPRFLDANDADAAAVEGWANGVHFEVTARDGLFGEGFHGDYKLTLATRFKNADALDRLVSQFKQYFTQMVGGKSGFLGIRRDREIKDVILKSAARLVLPNADIAKY